MEIRKAEKVQHACGFLTTAQRKKPDGGNKTDQRFRTDFLSAPSYTRQGRADAAGCMKEVRLSAFSAVCGTTVSTRKAGERSRVVEIPRTPHRLIYGLMPSSRPAKKINFLS